jgi:16S rRNA G966 N2-methylase RsmD
MDQLNDYIKKLYIGGKPNNKPYFINKCNIYFPSNNDKILIDEVGKYSISKPDKANLIADIIIKTMNTTNLTITDGTACIGGDTLAFSQKFSHVNSIELDKTRYEYLKHNMGIFGRTNISFYNDSYLNLYSTLKQDVIYLDPPWGGPEYKNQQYVKLSLGNMPLEELCRNIIENKLCKLIVLKLPFNYDLKDFKNLHRFKMYNLNRILLITFKILGD